MLGGLFSFEGLARILHEGFINLIVLRILITDGFDRSGIKAVNDGSWAGHEDRRMSGNDELCVARSAHLLEEVQELHLTLRRKGCLRFIQKIEAFDLVTRFEERHDGLSVGLRDQRLPSEIIDLTGIVCFPLIDQLGKITKDL